LGVLTLPQAQLVLVDTPGIHQPHHRLGEAMNAFAEEALADADVILVLFDLSRFPTDEDRRVAQRIAELPESMQKVCGLNKIDSASPNDLIERWNAYVALLPEVECIGISATNGDGLDQLLNKLIALLPEGPPFFDEQFVTDAYERDIAADLIRSAAMSLLREEVPHAIAVRIDQYKERGSKGAYIAATIFVERDSQKGIVIGKSGTMLKSIGSKAREDIEHMSGRKVFLDLRVKVLPRWRNDPKVLRRFGFKLT
jgi:GTP-binding protein Era